MSDKADKSGASGAPSVHSQKTEISLTAIAGRRDRSAPASDEQAPREVVSPAATSTKLVSAVMQAAASPARAGGFGSEKISESEEPVTGRAEPASETTAVAAAPLQPTVVMSALKIERPAVAKAKITRPPQAPVEPPVIPPPTVAMPVVRKTVLASSRSMPAVSRRPEGRAAKPPGWARGTSWDAWCHVWPVPAKVMVGDRVWERVDSIQLRNPDSEEAHSFLISDSEKLLREKGTQRYPGSGPLDGKGYRFEEGRACFELSNLSPDAPVVLLRQIWAQGREEGVLLAAGRRAGRIVEEEVDEGACWRNRFLTISESLVSGGTLEVEIRDEGSEGGMTLFYLAAYQPAQD